MAPPTARNSQSNFCQDIYWQVKILIKFRPKTVNFLVLPIQQVKKKILESKPNNWFFSLSSSAPPQNHSNRPVHGGVHPAKRQHQNPVPVGLTPVPPGPPTLDDAPVHGHRGHGTGHGGKFDQLANVAIAGGLESTAGGTNHNKLDDDLMACCVGGILSKLLPLGGRRGHSRRRRRWWWEGIATDEKSCP